MIARESDVHTKEKDIQLLSQNGVTALRPTEPWIPLTQPSLLDRVVSRRYSDLGPSWPPRSPDLLMCDSFLSQTVKSKVHLNNLLGLQELQQNIYDEIVASPASIYLPQLSDQCDVLTPLQTVHKAELTHNYSNRIDKNNLFPNDKFTQEQGQRRRVYLIKNASVRRTIGVDCTFANMRNKSSESYQVSNKEIEENIPFSIT
ncbi:hypothetical protein TNCV_2339221 [Trichonephila clavipes]|nr:hypothetical protein TNCV_2339221 [Trichonephila clavipes]